MGAAYTRDHLSIVLLNSQLWTSFSQNNTVLVSKRSPAIELCRLDFCSNFNFFASTMKTTVVSRKNSRNPSKIIIMLLKGILNIKFWQVYHK